MSSTFRFLGLPLEVRNQILGYLVGSNGILELLENRRRSKLLISSRAFRNLIHSSWGDVTLRTTIAYRYETGIMYTSRQMFIEASNTFYRDNLFVNVVTNSAVFYRLLADCGFMRILKPLSETCLPATIFIDLIWCNGSDDQCFKRFPCTKLGLMVPCSELGVLVQLLRRANLYKRHFLEGLQLTVRVVNTFKRSEEDLEKGLFPLQGLDHIQRVSIQGDLRQAYAEKLDSAISRLMLTGHDVLLQIVDTFKRIRPSWDGHAQCNLKSNVRWLKSTLADLEEVQDTYPEFRGILAQNSSQFSLEVMRRLILEYMEDPAYKDEALFFIEKGLGLIEFGRLESVKNIARRNFLFMKALVLLSNGKRHESLEIFDKIVKIPLQVGVFLTTGSCFSDCSETIFAQIQELMVSIRQDLNDTPV